METHSDPLLQLLVVRLEDHLTAAAKDGVWGRSDRGRNREEDKKEDGWRETLWWGREGGSLGADLPVYYIPQLGLWQESYTNSGRSENKNSDKRCNYKKGDNKDSTEMKEEMTWEIWEMFHFNGSRWARTYNHNPFKVWKVRISDTMPLMEHFLW